MLIRKGATPYFMALLWAVPWSRKWGNKNWKLTRAFGWDPAKTVVNLIAAIIAGKLAQINDNR